MLLMLRVWPCLLALSHPRQPGVLSPPMSPPCLFLSGSPLCMILSPSSPSSSLLVLPLPLPAYTHTHTCTHTTDYDAALKGVEQEFAAAEKALAGTRKKSEEAAAAMKGLEQKDAKVIDEGGWVCGYECVVTQDIKHVWLLW